MSRDEIINKIIKLLRMMGDSTLHQEPYKGDLFKLFVQAFNAGMLDRRRLNGDAYLGVHTLTESILAKAPEVIDVSSPYSNWCNFQNFWEEWIYAWDRAGARAAPVTH